MTEPADRWSAYTDLTPDRRAGWRLDVVTPPSRLGGSNGMTIGPDGRLYVTQVFVSQVTAIDVETGEHAVFSPLGSGISRARRRHLRRRRHVLRDRADVRPGHRAAAPTARYRVVRDDLPAANGVHDGPRRAAAVHRRVPARRPAARGRPGRCRRRRRILLEDLDGPNAPAMGPDGKLYFPQVFADQVWSYDLETGDGPPRRRRPGPTDGRQVRLAWPPRRLGGGRRADHRDRPGDRCTARCWPTVPLGIDNVSVGRRRPDLRVALRRRAGGRGDGRPPAGAVGTPGLLGPHGLAVDTDGTLLFADGLSVGAVIDGEPSAASACSSTCRRWRSAWSRSAARCAVLGAGGEVLRYDPRRRRADGAGRGPRRPDHACASTATGCWWPSAAPGGSAPSTATAA